MSTWPCPQYAARTADPSSSASQVFPIAFQSTPKKEKTVRGIEGDDGGELFREIMY